MNAQFGQNQWLVDDMYQRFQADPASVDASWRAYFAENPPQGAAGSVTPVSPIAEPDAAPVPDPPAKAPTPAETNRAESFGRTPARSGATTTTEARAVAAERPRPSGPVPPALAGATGRVVHQTQEKQPRRLAPRHKIAPERPRPESGETQLRGAANAVVKNMDLSLSIPTATSVRAVPAKLMIDNRVVINNHLRRTRGGKISFTHILGYAMVRALRSFPGMNNHYAEKDGKPFVVVPEHVNLGLAIDLPGKGGKRALVVAAIRECESKDFLQFWSAYEDIVRRARDGKLTTEDFSGVTISLTNPGGIGTNHSVPRLMKGQGAIIGAGSLDYPAEFAGTSERRLAEMGVGKLLTLTSTYDHRIIQGAESGEYLKTIHQLLIDDGFWDDVFVALRIPYEPVRWAQDITDDTVDKDARVLELITAYRDRGHLMADIDPLQFALGGVKRITHPDLDINTHELTLWDLDREFKVGGFAGREHMTLREVLSVLRNAYCRKVGTEYTHILESEQRRWIQERVEKGQPKPTVAQQKYILSNINAAEAFETFLQTKYVGQKRFSLEGAESVIPLMDAVIDTAAEHGLDEVVIGMPHRGRLNVLANVVGKPYKQIFTEFEGNMDPGSAQGSGDVKYHLGAEGTHIQMFGDNDIKVSLTANPSHLEAVDPVLEGIVRAKQDVIDRGDAEGGYSVMPLMLHGDAAFAGLGIVQETLNLALLRGYRVGGTIHVIVNNQVGFTTAPENSRSSQYCSDVAKMTGSPVLHVNGDDPEACVWVAQMAVDFRQRFGKDVVIDLVCYRRRGHNEADDPSMTQPAMYDIIDAKPSIRKTYTDDLIGRGDISAKEAEAALRDYQGQLEQVFNDVRDLESHPPQPSESITGLQPLPTEVHTEIDHPTIIEIADAFVSAPAGFTVHPRVKPVCEHRAKMAREGNVDWAFAELLAFGSLVLDGRVIRLAGEDSRRGTFTQRHAVLVDRQTSAEYSPLSMLAEKSGGKFMVYDSALTEYAGMGFEYGYSLGNPDAVVLWEAQFGDFANGAQTIIDEFVASGEAKWGQKSAVVLLLPHGHEGMGPDHSSARPERFLQLCAEGSMTVAHPSTPANYFHLLRRHAIDGMLRPLVVFTPKSMLRNKQAVSSIAEFTDGRFRSVIDDPTFVGEAQDASADPQAVRTILLTSGKLYYELDAKRKKDKRGDIAIVRLEQLHPIPFRRLREAFAHYPNAAEVRWVQDEPANQGAWPFLGLELPELVEDMPRLRRVSRRAMAATSSGVAKVHLVEQKQLLEDAFAKNS